MGWLLTVPSVKAPGGMVETGGRRVPAWMSGSLHPAPAPGQGQEWEGLLSALLGGRLSTRAPQPSSLSAPEGPPAAVFRGVCSQHREAREAAGPVCQ